MKKFFLYIMSLAYLLAGINHFWHPVFYVRIMPPYIPYHLLIVYVSGVCEFLFALLLLPPATRRIGAWLIYFLLLAVFPANVQMAVNDYLRHDYHHLWISLLRLPIQIPLLWWALQYTKTGPLTQSSRKH